MRRIPRALVVLVCGLLGTALLARENIREVPGRSFDPRFVVEGQSSNVTEAQARSNSNRLEIQLPHLSSAARSSIRPPQPGTPLQVGVHRDLPMEWDRILGSNDFQWEPLGDGTYVATLTVESPGAAALRTAIRFHSLPEGTEILFYALDSPGRPFGPYVLEDLLPTTRNEWFWSPVVAGESMGIEILVRDFSSSSNVRISLERVAHYSALLFDEQFTKGLGDSGRCNKDLACREEWLETGDSVVLIFFESGRNSNACSGQLIAHNNPNPNLYFVLTARHCISKQKEAKSATFLWFYQRVRCNKGSLSNLIQTSAKARLRFKTPKIGRRKSTDHSLLQLRRPPPRGVTFSGWSTRDPVELVGDNVVGLHHPYADLKKVSRGRIVDIFQLDTFSVQTPYTHFFIDWKLGITEPGSSGSGLWIGTQWPNQYLVGVLTGGLSTCRSKRSWDWYGLFSETYRKYAKFRNLIDPPQTNQ